MYNKINLKKKIIITNELLIDDEASEQAISMIQSDDRQASTDDEATSHEFTTSHQSPVSAIGELRQYDGTINTVRTTRCYRMRFEQCWAGATTVAMRGRTARKIFFPKIFELTVEISAIHSTGLLDDDHLFRKRDFR